MEILLGATPCEADCGETAIVGLGGRALCLACYEAELEQLHGMIERALREWDLEAERRLEMIRSPLLCGDDEP